MDLFADLDAQLAAHELHGCEGAARRRLRARFPARHTQFECAREHGEAYWLYVVSTRGMRTREADWFGARAASSLSSLRRRRTRSRNTPAGSIPRAFYIPYESLATFSSSMTKPRMASRACWRFSMSSLSASLASSSSLAKRSNRACSSVPD